MPTQKVSRNVTAAGLSQLAMSMVLPHENKPIRLPVVPVAYTALLDVMNNGTWPLPDGQSRRAFLCRDPAYPLWIERNVTAASCYLEAIGTAQSWIIPARSNSTLLLPTWDSAASAVSGVPQIDGVASTQPAIQDLLVLGEAPGTTAFYVPPGSQFCVRFFIGTTGTGSGIELEFVSQVGGEEYTATIVAVATPDGYGFAGVAGTPGAVNGISTITVGTLGEGTIPQGFTYLKQIRTTATAPSLTYATPILQVGWASGGQLAAPSGTALVMVPYGMPPEFNNSTIPYQRSRANSTAALFTNVTAALSKEGTVLAARLKADTIDPWAFGAVHLNSVHPSMRYFGPLEKGLYTFTSPTGSLEALADGVMTIPSNSNYNKTAKPLFNYKDIGAYNAMLFSDLGSASVGTQLAVSAYWHVEFETTSTLFSPGVSNQPLEMLHAAEVALLRFGHFHENPLHWAAIATAARAALQYVAPMVAPYAKAAAAQVLKAGVQYAKDKLGPKTNMARPPKQNKPKKAQRGAKPKGRK